MKTGIWDCDIVAPNSLHDKSSPYCVGRVLGKNDSHSVRILRSEEGKPSHIILLKRCMTQDSGTRFDKRQSGITRGLFQKSEDFIKLETWSPHQ